MKAWKKLLVGIENILMIKLIKPYIQYQDIEKEFKQIFESGWFTKGKFVESFRNELCTYTGSKHAHLTTSATTALYTCLKILNVKAGDEVIVSDFSYPASANVIEDIGATPIFADVDPKTYNMLPGELESKISPKTKAVMFVDALGSPSGIHKIKDICSAHNIPLIEDAACAMGSSENKVKCGNIADLTCFSFHPRKLLTTGEGGAITTNNDDYNQLLNVKLNHGATVTNSKFDFVDFGYNFRLTEMQSAMGIHQLSYINEIVSSRNIIRDQYIQSLSSATDLVAQSISDSTQHNVQSLVFTVPKTANRDALIAHLKNNDIETTLGTYALSDTTFFRNKYYSIQKNSKFLCDNTITLPCYDGVDVDYVSTSIQKFFK